MYVPANRSPTGKLVSNDLTEEVVGKGKLQKVKNGCEKFALIPYV